MCESALRSEPMSQSSSESMSRKPVIGVGPKPSMRPLSGAVPSFMANRNCSSMASQKAAMARPETLSTRTTWSHSELRFSADTTPSGMPTAIDRMMATRVSSSVAGRRCGEILRDRALSVEAGPEIAREHVAKMPHQLHGERLVVAELDAHRLDLPGRGVLAQEHAHRIGRDDVGDQEYDHDQAGQRGHEPRQPRNDHLQAAHRRRCRLSLPPPARGEVARERDHE